MSFVQDRPKDGFSIGAALGRRLMELVANPRFQSWAARFPLTRGMARRDGARLFDLVAGFAYSQVLQAFVAFDLPSHLAHGPRASDDLAARLDVPPARMAVLCQAAASLGLLKRRRDGRFALARLGAALSGVGGLPQMILHHKILYGDLADSASFFRGQTKPELARFWPYVFGAGAAKDPDLAAQYSDLMADSQSLVAQETLDAIDLPSGASVVDIGGGTGAFLAALKARYPKADVTLFDLPAVMDLARARFAAAGIAARLVAGSFRDDPLPEGAQVMTLIRVLYDHQDATVRRLLAKVYDSLPIGGQVIISEPMSGGDRPERSADAYFALYCMAMETGRVRSPAQISELLAQAGFQEITKAPVRRPFVTQVVCARKLPRRDLGQSVNQI